MKKSILTIGIIVIVLIAGGYALSTVNDEFKRLILDFANEHVLGKTEGIIEISKPVDFFVIADGTGSRYINYAIPEVDTGFINKAISEMHSRDGGKFWLSYIDRDSKNNRVLYLKVQPKMRRSKPIRKSGETSFAFSHRLKEWKGSESAFQQDSIWYDHKFQTEKRKFLQLCHEMLKVVYKKGTADNQWTDVIGSLNATFATLSQLNDENEKKYIVCFSDLQQDTPYLNPKPKLNTLPSDVTLLAVNPSIGSSKKATEGVTEVEHPLRVFEVCFNNP